MEPFKNLSVICILLLGCLNFTYQSNCDFDTSDYPCDDVQLEKNLLAVKPFPVWAGDACMVAGIFAHPENASNYYVCLPGEIQGFLRFDFSCGSEQYFDDSTKQCKMSSETTASTPAETSETTTVPPITTLQPSTKTVPPPSTITTTTAAATTTTTTTAHLPSSTSTTEFPTISTTLAPSPEDPFTCTAPGAYPIPSNCKFYYRCSVKYFCTFFRCTTSMKMSAHICPGFSFFNEIIGRCSHEISPTCLAQILGKSRAGPVTAARKSTKAFDCPAGEKIPFPDDCSRYFQCSDSGTAFLYNCPVGLYFDASTKSCNLTKTPRCELSDKSENPQ